MKKLSVVCALGVFLMLGQSFYVNAENLSQAPRVIYRPTYNQNIPANAKLFSDKVLVELTLDEFGAITNVTIKDGSGNAEVDKSVRDFVYSWQLTPALNEKGEPAKSTVTTMIRLDIPNTAVVLSKDAPRQPGESFSDYVKRTSK